MCMLRLLLLSAAAGGSLSLCATLALAQQG